MLHFLLTETVFHDDCVRVFQTEPEVCQGPAVTADSATARPEGVTVRSLHSAHISTVGSFTV